MGMHSLSDLKLKWEHESITDEQMIGQLLQHIEALYDEQLALRREIRQLAQALAATTATDAHANGKPKAKAKGRTTTGER
jgi:hypothetical protein